ncbi:MAG: LamG-like jellyroll fold domain-containing protein [Planctomycetota bacterium]
MFHLLAKIKASMSRPDSAPAVRVEPLEPRVLFSGDTLPGVSAIYPAQSFLHNNPDGRIIDITRVEDIPAINAPNATPWNYSDDDGRAINAALDFVVDKLRADVANETAFSRDPSTSYVIYVPKGVFHVEDTVEYSGDPYRYVVQLRIEGQSRETSEIRLKNNRAAFNNGEKRAIIDFSQNTGDDPNEVGFLNWQSSNILRNITVGTGSGNPDAVGVDFWGANSAEISNVTIRSTDGQGEVGLHMPIGMVSGYYHDITIEGFDRGMLIEPYHFAHPTFENVTLTGQNEVGVRVVNSQPTFRNLLSDNSAPAIHATDGGAHVVLIDSELRGGLAGDAAIIFDDSGVDRDPNPIDAQDIQSPLLSVGHVFARDVRIGGYGTAIERDGVAVVTGSYIDEYVSDSPFGFDSDQRLRTLNLDVPDVPATPWPDVSKWVSPEDYGAVGNGIADDSAAVQAAFNDPNAEVVYFPSAVYRIETAVNVPDHINRVNLQFTTLIGGPSGAFFRVNEDAPKPLVFDDLYSTQGFFVRHDQPRELVMNTIRATVAYSNPSSGDRGDVFLNNVTGFGKVDQADIKNQNVYARFINSEQTSAPNFTVGDGGLLWVLGYKVEGATESFEVESGGTLEVLGGITVQFARNTFQPGDVPFLLNDGTVSIVASSSGRRIDVPHFDDYINDTREGVNSIVQQGDSEVPERIGRINQFVIPMYASYDVGDLPIGAAQLAHYPFDDDFQAPDAPDAINDGASFVAGVSGSAVDMSNQQSVVFLDEIGDAMNTGAGAVSFWFRSNETDNGMLIYGSDAPGGNGFTGQNEFYITTSGPNNLMLLLESGGNNDTRIFFSDGDGDITDGQWHHVAASWDSQGQIDVYVDGALSKSATHNGNVFSFSEVFKLGEAGLDGAADLDGSIDEVKLFGRPLTAEEIGDIYNENPFLFGSVTVASNSFPPRVASLMAVEDFGIIGAAVPALHSPLAKLEVLQGSVDLRGLQVTPVLIRSDAWFKSDLYDTFGERTVNRTVESLHTDFTSEPTKLLVDSCVEFEFSELAAIAMYDSSGYSDASRTSDSMAADLGRHPYMSDIVLTVYPDLEFGFGLDGLNLSL